MIRGLGRFVESLREEGVAVSPAEVLDAARAVDVVGLEDRSRFRAALRATLAKGRRQAEVFDRLFDRFFAPPARRGSRRGEEGTGAGAKGRGASGAGARPVPRPVSREERGRVPRPPRDERGERGRGDAEDRRPERIARALEKAGERGPRRVGRLRKAWIARGDRSETGAAGENDPRRTDLDRPMATEEERRLARLVPRLVDEIRLKAGRRLRRSSSGRIWARRIFRENVSRGGIPFVLPRRRARPRRPRVVLLVDVSHSVARAAGYFLQMAAEFLAPGRQARVVAFVDRPVDATHAIARWTRRGGAPEPAVARRRTARAPRRAEGIERGGVSFADVVEGLPGLDPAAPSDYGRAFHALLRSHLRPAGRDTVLLILGDGRSNRYDPLSWALDEIARRCRSVIWLVPEPRSRWGTADSALADYLPHVDVVVEAKDLGGLSKGLAELLRRL